MVRRIAGTICLASSLMMILWLATGATASGFVKFALLGIVGSILVLYKFDEIAARMPSNRPAVTGTQLQGAPDGVFGTELPPEAFAEPVLEAKPVNLSTRTEIFHPREDAEGDDGQSDQDGSVLVAERDTDTDTDTDSGEQLESTAETNGSAPRKDSDGTSETDEQANSVEPVQEDSLVQPDPTQEVVMTNGSGTTSVVASSEPVFIQLADYSDDELVQSVRAGEASLVSTLAESGMLSTEGPVTDNDVATMVFVAVSSDDLLRALIDGKEAEAQAAALSYTPDTPQLYEPAAQLVEPRS